MPTQRSDDGLLRVVVIVLGVIVLFPVVMMLFAMPMLGTMGWWGDGIAGGLPLLWGFGMMLVWLVVLLGIGYLLYRGFAGGLGTGAASDPALEELRLAYARGDLTEEEFEERQTKLRNEE